MENVASGTLRPGESRVIGSVLLFYAPAEIDGTRPVPNGPQLRADAGDVGTWEPVVPGGLRSIELGSRRVDVHASDQEPVEVAVDVAVTSCPRESLLQRSAQPQSMWLSTEGILRHSFQAEDSDDLDIRLVHVEGAPMIQVAENAYFRRLSVRPGTRTQIRANGHMVRIDEVVPGPGTSFDEAWNGEGPLRLHVRVGIETAPPVASLSELARGPSCGEASPRPTTVPEALARIAPVIDDLYLELGAKASTGPIELEFASRKLDATRITFDELHVRGEDPGAKAVAVFHEELQRSYAVRVERALLRVDPTGDKELRIRRLKLRCPPEVAIEAGAEPTYVWLSTIGHRMVRVGSQATLAIELEPGVEGAFLTAAAGERVYGRRVEPAAVGDAFTAGEWLVEVVQVTGSGDARHEDVGRWRTSATLPAVHVQVRLSRDPLAGAA
jgi:hypothetical protein